MTFKQITVTEAREILSTKKSVLADIRDKESFNESHAEEALHLREDNIVNFINTIDKDTHVLVICYQGNSSQTVAAYLSGQGFNNVYSIIGGYEKWIE